MGSGILRFYREKIRKEWKLAFFSAFLVGLLVHLYKFTNLFPNADSLYNFYNDQNMTMSGRWFLSIACGFGSWFDLPWTNGVLSLLFLGLAAAMVAEVFRMENPVLIVLSSALMVSFPAVTATLAYEFTADGYMLAMVLAAFSACLSRMEYISRKHWPRLVLSSVCICLACGIYQAYVSFAFALAVCYFITELMENRRSDKEIRNWILIQILIYGCALASYYLIWKLCLAFQDIAATTYQGIDQVGVMNAGSILRALMKIAKDFVVFFVEWNILDHGVTVYSVLNMLFLVLLAFILAVSAAKSGILKRKGHLALLVLCLAALPVGCYMWYLTSPDVVYHALMLQSMCLWYILAAVLFERWGCRIGQDLALLVLAAIMFNNSVTANMYYNFMQQCYEKTYSMAVEVITRIHMLDDGTIKKVAFYGGLDEWEEEDYFAHDKLRQLGAWKNVKKNLLTPLFLSHYTEFDLSYYQANERDYEQISYDPESPTAQGTGSGFALMDAQTSAALAQMEQVQQMPVWPARDSLQVIGDTVVVKLSEMAPESKS